MSIFQLFDHYSLRARLQPALTTLLPLAFAIYSWWGPSRPWMSAIWSVAGTAGATYLLSTVVRNRGKQIEPELWKSWGGAPTTQKLRHNGASNSVLRARWHSYVSKITGRAVPTEEEERQDPEAADQIYEAGVKLVILKTRESKRFPLIYKENVQYGFCRNLYAMRTIGILLAAFGLVSSCGAIGYFQQQNAISAIPIVCAAANLLLLVLWVTRINGDWVKVPALAYADRLLEATEILSNAKSRQTKDRAEI